MKKIRHINSILLLMLTLTIVELGYTESKPLSVLTLTAREVYRLLRQIGRQDAIPEGRIITQGLAAMTGFALGLKKALAGVIIYDFITANVTDLDLGIGTIANTSAVVGTRQEICFNSRKSRNLEEADAIADAYEWLDKREGRLNKSRRRKGKSYRHRSDKRHHKANGRQVTTTSAISPTTTTGSLLPTTTDTAGTGLTSATTTFTGNEAATSCIVLQNR